MGAAEPIDLDIATARVFHPLLQPSRYKGAHGGRGSGKSHFFGGLVVERCLMEPGLRVVCIREVQKSLKESAKKLIEDKIQEYGVGHLFAVLDNEIRTPGGGLIIFQGMQDHTSESIKSLEGFDIAWVEEAQTISKRSLQLLRPTIRAEGSELWFSWNPRHESDPVDVLLRTNPPTDAIVVRANWNDNPWFPAVLEAERQDCLRDEPEQYDHIWDGGYVTVAEGAYFAHKLIVARQEGRIGNVGRDELQQVKLFCDIGGTGAKSDAFSIWAVQFIGKEIRAINYYEAVGQSIDEHLAWMWSNRFTPDRSKIYLPHDGTTNDRVFDVSYESQFRKAGYDVEVVKNQGAGAAMMRIEAVRNVFSRCWFDETQCVAGLKALGWYHPKIDEVRGVDLGPDHDWSSHAADSFGLMAISYREPVTHQQTRRQRRPAPDWRT
ncbi:MAG: PBSX family phage terminase large subunit [Haliea sp.]|nr:PBSX family phage terminase large subunit [Haliea sp.]